MGCFVRLPRMFAWVGRVLPYTDASWTVLPTSVHGMLAAGKWMTGGKLFPQKMSARQEWLRRYHLPLLR
jgi:hypothetical protein